LQWFDTVGSVTWKDIRPVKTTCATYPQMLSSRRKKTEEKELGNWERKLKGNWKSQVYLENGH